VYNRGLYFDGGDALRVPDLMLHHTHTIQAWVFIVQTGVNMFTINDQNFVTPDETNRLTFDLSPPYAVRYNFKSIIGRDVSKEEEIE
jgi:hypothetical protein